MRQGQKPTGLDSYVPLVASEWSSIDQNPFDIDSKPRHSPQRSHGSWDTSVGMWT